MRSPIKFTFVTVVVIACFTSYAAAQGGLKWEAGINISAYTYQGDLTPSWMGSTATPSFGFSLFANRLVTNSLSFRTSFVFGKLRASDATYSEPTYRQQRNLKFHTSLLEISEMAVWNIFGNSRSFSNFPVSPYLMGGLGLALVNIKRDASTFNPEYFATEQWVINGLADDLAHATPRALIVIPAGAGLRFPVTSKISAHTEAIYRFTNTDYLDGFSKAANPGKKDRYTSYSIGITYSFGKKGAIYCPPVKK